MSVVNILINSTRGYLLSASAGYDSNGTVIGTDYADLVVKRWPGGIAGRGTLWGKLAVAEIAEHFSGFDAFVSGSAPLIERAHAEAVSSGAIYGAQRVFEAFALGWSEGQDRPIAYRLLAVPDGLGDEIETDADDVPYVWREVSDDGLWATPPISMRMNWRLAREGVSPDFDYEPDEFDPVKHGLPLLEQQRREKILCPGLKVPLYIVGGDAMVIEVSRDGVKQTCLHSWDDVVGFPIRPEPDLVADTLPLTAPPWITGDLGVSWLRSWRRGEIDPETLLRKPTNTTMNRHQRRAAARR